MSPPAKRPGVGSIHRLNVAPPATRAFRRLVRHTSGPPLFAPGLGHSHSRHEWRLTVRGGEGSDSPLNTPHAVPPFHLRVRR